MRFQAPATTSVIAAALFGVVFFLSLLHSVSPFTIPFFSTVKSSTFNDNPATTTATTATLETEIQQQTQKRLRSKHDNEAWNALFVSCPERPVPTPIIVETMIGKIPIDFPPGCLLRLGPNGAASTDGFFDGDGMIQSITFPPSLNLNSNNNNNNNNSNHHQHHHQQQMFATTYIETKGRTLEHTLGKKFKGTLGGVPQAYPMIQSLLENAFTFQTLQAQKDTCNTAIAEHGGRILALMEQCPPTEIEVTQNGEIRTVQSNIDLDGAIDTSLPITGGSMSAHGRTCPETGNRIHISYRSDTKPYLRMDTFAKEGWKLKETRGIDIPTPIFLHDSCITENYAVVMDLPLTLRTSRILQNRFPVEYEPDHPARIGLVPINQNSHREEGDNVNDDDVMWFDCKPGVVLHVSNAWETDNGKTVIVQGFRGVPKPKECYLQQFCPSYFYEYSINLSTGRVTEKVLNPEHVVEFPVVNNKYHGRQCSACYCLEVASIGGPLQVYRQPNEGVSFGGILKLAAVETSDFKKGDVIGQFMLPDRWFAVSEPTVLSKVGKEGEGEYVLIIATNVPEGITWKDVAADYDGAPLQSKVFLLDGDDMNKGPIYSASLPFHVNYGLHSEFIDWEHLK